MSCNGAVSFPNRGKLPVNNRVQQLHLRTMRQSPFQQYYM